MLFSFNIYVITDQGKTKPKCKLNLKYILIKVAKLIIKDLLSKPYSYTYITRAN